MLRRLVLTILLITGIVALVTASMPVTAAGGIVKLQLGGEGATPWNIINIRPGDLGLKTVILQNTGTIDGTVRIWLTDVINAEGVNPEPETGDTAIPGELGQYLLLKVTASGLTSNLNFPVPINSFPQSANSPSYIQIDSLRAGQSKTLVWEWSLPSPTGNEVQGDVITFTINYLLEEIIPDIGGDSPSGPAPAPVPAETSYYLELVAPNTQSKVILVKQEKIVTSTVFNALDNKLTLSLDSGTKIVGDNGKPLTRLEITESKETRILPDGFVRLSPVYSLRVYTSDGTHHAASFDPPLRLVLNYDPSRLPEDTSSIFLAYYDEDGEAWVQLQEPEGFIAGDGKAAAQINHFSLIAVLARVAPKAPEPARFRLGELVVNPPQIKAGENTVITVHVANVGGLSGEYTLKIDVKDLLQTSRMIRIAPGEDRVIRIEVTAPSPGIYEVVIGNQRGYFTVEGAPETPMGEPFGSWWIFLVVIATMILLASLLVIRRSRHQDNTLVKS